MPLASNEAEEAPTITDAGFTKTFATVAAAEMPLDDADAAAAADAAAGMDDMTSIALGRANELLSSEKELEMAGNSLAPDDDDVKKDEDIAVNKEADGAADKPAPLLALKTPIDVDGGVKACATC